MKRLLIVSTMSAGLLAACGDQATDTSQQYATTNVGIAVELTEDAATAAPFALANAVDTGGAVSVTTASVNVAEIAFKATPGACHGGDGEETGDASHAEENMDRDEMRRMATDTTNETDHEENTAMVGHCGGDGFVVIEGPFRFNLMTGEATPSLSSVTMPTGDYRWVDLRLAPVAATGDTMTGVSVLADGVYASDATTVPVRIAMVVQDPPIRIQPANGISITGDDGASLVIGISAKDWFAGVDTAIAACADDANAPIVGGVLQITGATGTSCDAVNGKLRQNFIGAGEKANVHMEAHR